MSAPTTYSTAIKGTIFSATAAMRCKPPRMIRAAIIISMMPITMEITEIPPICGASTLAKNAGLNIQRDLIDLPHIANANDARMAHMEKRTARIFPIHLQFFFLPRPSFR